jgi:hypothetical protein
MGQAHEQQLCVGKALRESERCGHCDGDTRVTAHAINRDANYGSHVSVRRSALGRDKPVNRDYSSVLVLRTLRPR